MRDRDSRPVGLVISPGDGATLSCTVRQMSGIHGDRWVIRTQNGTVLVGPPAGCARNGDIESLITEWWEIRKALGYADVNAASLRARFAATAN